MCLVVPDQTRQEGKMETAFDRSEPVFEIRERQKGKKTDLVSMFCFSGIFTRMFNLLGNGF